MECPVSLAGHLRSVRSPPGGSQLQPSGSPSMRLRHKQRVRPEAARRPTQGWLDPRTRQLVGLVVARGPRLSGETSDPCTVSGQQARPDVTSDGTPGRVHNGLASCNGRCGRDRRVEGSDDRGAHAGPDAQKFSATPKYARGAHTRGPRARVLSGRVSRGTRTAHALGWPQILLLGLVPVLLV